MQMTNHIQPLDIFPEKKTKLFELLSGLGFSGKVIWQDASRQKWVFFYSAGHLLYATGGKHPLRRWRRVLQQQALGREANRQLLSVTPSQESSLDLLDHQDYLHLGRCLQAGKLTQEQEIALSQKILVEVLSDLFLSQDVTFTVIEQPPSPSVGQSYRPDAKSAISEAFNLWDSWKRLNFELYLPDQAPTIREPEKIRQKTNKQLYEVLTTLLNGQNTLRDIAVKMGRDVTQITQALHTFIQLNWIELIDIPDTMLFEGSIGEKPSLTPESPHQQPLVACVDDSPLICQSMESIITTNGYRFVSVQDPLRVISILLSKKPDIIFLDLVMPYTNGYEICSRLRKISQFSSTPIIILSGNDGVIDQVRARLMGATSFVSKPVEQTLILNTVRQYLKSPISV